MSQTKTLSAIIIASIFISLVVGQTCPAGVNLIQNPSFETPQITSGSSALVPLDGIPSWQGVLVDANCPTPGSLEVQNNVFGWTASDGAQWVELDAQCNTAIIQDIQTVPGQLYVLSYDLSPRPGTDAPTNVENVYYNGDRINSVSASGIGLTNTNWTTYTQLVTGGGPDELVFESLGTSDGLGALVDNVYLCPLMCDPPRPCYSLTMDPVLGCNYVPAPDGTPCSASCSRYVCQAGNCVPPPVPCDQPEDHKYYPGYHYEHKEYKYQKSYGHHEVHYGYGSQYQYTPVHHEDDDDYKPKHHGDDDDYKPEYKPKKTEHKSKNYEYKSEEDEYKPKEYKPKDYEYKSDEDEYKPKEYKPKEYKPKYYEYESEEDEYKPKEYKPKDYGYKSEEDEYKPKDYEYKSEDYEYKSEDYEYKPKEYKNHGYKPEYEEDEYKPKEYKPKEYEYESPDYEYNPKESKGYGYHKDEYEPDFDFDDYFKVDDHEYSSSSGGRRSHH